MNRLLGMDSFFISLPSPQYRILFYELGNMCSNFYDFQNMFVGILTVIMESRTVAHQKLVGKGSKCSILNVHKLLKRNLFQSGQLGLSQCCLSFGNKRSSTSNSGLEVNARGHRHYGAPRLLIIAKNFFSTSRTT